MKKFMITALMSLALSPLSGLAEGVCGLPPATKEKSFCDCFITESQRACRLVQPQNACSLMFSIMSSVPGKNYENFCRMYKAFLPKDVTINECALNVAYYNNYCK